MKKAYESPEMIITCVKNSDVITLSATTKTTLGSKGIYSKTGKTSWGSLK